VNFNFDCIALKKINPRSVRNREYSGREEDDIPEVGDPADRVLLDRKTDLA
jgi:hypothetical protein